MKKLDCYYINRATCAIVPIDKDVSEVHELDDVYIVDKSVTSIIDESCKFFGCSYKGRVDGSKKMLNMTYKLPIVIEEFYNLIFFPTCSPRFGHCIWISLNNISKYLKNEKNSLLVFKSDKELELNISYYSLENQIFRATMLDSIVRRRRNG